MEANLDWVERAAIIDLVCDGTHDSDLRLVLEDEKPKTATMVINDTKSDAAFAVHVKSRRVGEDTGRDVLLDVAGQLRALREGQRDVHRKLTDKERALLKRIHSRFESKVPRPFDYVKF
jgi:hypothetical protein